MGRTAGPQRQSYHFPRGHRSLPIATLLTTASRLSFTRHPHSVLASSRGALPETIGDAGFLFDIPERYTPQSRELPTPGEVEPWVEAILRLWDDDEYYAHWSQAAKAPAQLWHPDRVGPLYRDFFSNLFRQPGPPLLPRCMRPQARPPEIGPPITVFRDRHEMVLRLPHHAMVAEIGVDRGEFSRSILRTEPKKLYLIDPWERQTGEYAGDPINAEDYEAKFGGVRETLGRVPNVEIVRDYSLKAVERFPDGYFDWIYLDADHSYQAVMADLAAWIKKIKPGGVFAGHDYCNFRWVQVQPALDEFLRGRGRRLDYLTRDGPFLSWGFVV